MKRYLLALGLLAAWACQGANPSFSDFNPAWFDTIGNQVNPSSVFGSNLTLKATGTTAPRSLGDRFSEQVNVKDFGALGDGVHDDTDAIQATLNFASDIYLPSGNFLITQTLYGSSNQKFSGVGTIIGTSTNFTELAFYSKTNVLIDGITFEAKGDALSGYFTNHNCISLSLCKNVTVNNCRLSNFGHCGVLLVDSSYCAVQNCTITGLYPPLSEYAGHVVLLGGGVGNRFENNILSKGSTAIQIITDTSLSGLGPLSGVASNNLIINNIIFDFTRYGIIDYLGHNPATNYANLIKGNTVLNITGSSAGVDGLRHYGTGIYLQGACGDMVQGNLINKCSALTDTFDLAAGCIGVSGTTECTISDNSCEGGAYAGIYVNSPEFGNSKGIVNISGGRVSKCLFGIIVQNEGNVNIIGVNLFEQLDCNILISGSGVGPTNTAENVTVTGCRIDNERGGSAKGIRASGTRALRVSDSTFASLNYGIYLESTTTNSHIVNNLFRHSEYGIYAASGATADTDHNQFIDLVAGITHSGITIGSRNSFAECISDISGNDWKSMADTVFFQKTADIYPTTIMKIAGRGNNPVLGALGSVLQLDNQQEEVFGGGSEVVFSGRGSSTTAVYAAISAPIGSASSVGSVGWLSFSTKAVATDTALTERMKIDKYGNVTIGGNVTAGSLVAASVLYTNCASAPLAATIGGSVGSVTNHMLLNMGGLLMDYWSDGTSLYSKQLAP